jgi:ABC-2 type transport system permease protein
VGFDTATGDRHTIRNFTDLANLTWALAVSGFRRFATYRQATVAALVTNSVFGFLRTYVMLAVAGVGGTVAGYSGPQLITYVWAGQGLIGVVVLWGWTDLSDRIRSGDVVTDLLRPVSPVYNYLAVDLGRAGYGMLVRFTAPMLVGALAFGLYLPRRLITYPLFLISTVLAVVVCFSCRFLVNTTCYWLLDNRGVVMTWTMFSGVLGGLYFPIHFLPGWAVAAVWLGTPGPSLLQAPLDVLVERDPLPYQLGIIGVQVCWTLGLLALCRLVQRRAEVKLVVLGG